MQYLSRRQNEIAGLLSLGYSEKEIASRLNVSVDTVHTHKKNIFRVIGVRSVVDLAREIISRVTGMNVSRLIRENVIEPNAYRVTLMLVFLSLQFVAMNAGLDYRRTRITVKTVRVARTRRGDV